MHQEQTVSSERGYLRVDYLSWVLNHSETSEVKCRLSRFILFTTNYIFTVVLRASIITVLFKETPFCCQEITWLADLKL